MIKGIHHIAIICSDYASSKHFYTQILGLKILRENYRESRSSYKLDLEVNGKYIIELFSFEDAPERLSQPEAVGLRHLAFVVDDLDKIIVELKTKGIESEKIRVDEFTGKRFTFINDPDKLPIELYEE